MFIDSHAHLTSSQVADHVEEVLQRAQQHQVKKIVNICTDKTSLEKGLLLSKRHPWVYNAAATTPHDVEKDGEAFFPVVEKEAGRLVALGETGLDYYYEHSNREVQQAFLIRYFQLAIDKKLPLIFHCRDAFQDLFALADLHYKGQKAVLHCFTGTVDEAKGCLDRGWMVSFSGIITFKKSEKLREVVAYLPLDRMLIETDTPYLAPESKRGKLNEPGYIGETAAVASALKKIDVAALAHATTENAAAFFSFPKED
jgi:TatD DNase family protein